MKKANFEKTATIGLFLPCILQYPIRFMAGHEN